MTARKIAHRYVSMVWGYANKLHGKPGGLMAMRAHTAARSGEWWLVVQTLRGCSIICPDEDDARRHVAELADDVAGSILAGRLTA